MARVVVTGGAGFIGSNLADELALEHEVVIIDDLSTGRAENLRGSLSRSNVTFLQGSILDIDSSVRPLEAPSPLPRHSLSASVRVH